MTPDPVISRVGGTMNDRGTVEVEWQFDAPDLEAVGRWLRAQPPHAALTLEDRGEKMQRDTYLDGDMWQVWHAGYSLRVRDKGDTRETTLKGLPSRRADRSRAANAPVSRAEHTEADDLAPVMIGGGPVGSRLRLMLRGTEPRPLFRVVTRRHTWVVRAGETLLAEIAIDDTTFEDADGTSSNLKRVEVEEITAGALAGLHAFIGAMQADCALTPAATSKFESGLRAAGLRPGPPDLGPTEITADDLAVDRAYAVVRRRAGEFLARESGTALGEDLEELHEMRVATRRLRAALRVFDEVLPSVLVELRDELAWFAGPLGAVRDLDVQLEYLESLRVEAAWAEGTAMVPLVAQFARQRDEARAALLAALDSDRYARLVRLLRTLLVQAGLLAGPDADSDDTTSRREGRRIIQRRFRRFRDDARALRRDSPHVEYHALRIRGKRLRYSLELFVDLYGRAGARALASLRGLQDQLGELQDLATTDDRLRGLVQSRASELPADTLVMIGRLIERHHDRAREIVRVFPRGRDRVLRDFARLGRELRSQRRARAETLVVDGAAATDEPLSEGTSTALVVVPGSLTRRDPRAVGALRAVVRFVLKRRR